jgi:hypothetical protein
MTIFCGFGCMIFMRLYFDALEAAWILARRAYLFSRIYFS